MTLPWVPAAPPFFIASDGADTISRLSHGQDHIMFDVDFNATKWRSSAFSAASRSFQPLVRR